jgi:hypothetical protein
MKSKKTQNTNKFLLHKISSSLMISEPIGAPTQGKMAPENLQAKTENLKDRNH